MRALYSHLNNNVIGIVTAFNMFYNLAKINNEGMNFVKVYNSFKTISKQEKCR